MSSNGVGRARSKHRSTMTYYAGIDVSLEYSSVCVVDGAGKIMREQKIASEPEALIAWFRGLGFELERIGLEAGPMSQWLYRKHISPPSSSAIGIPSIADALQNDHCPARRAPAPARRIWRGCRPERGVRPAKRSGTAISATGRGGNARRYGRHQRPAPCGSICLGRFSSVVS